MIIRIEGSGLVKISHKNQSLEFFGDIPAAISLDVTDGRALLAASSPSETLTR